MALAAAKVRPCSSSVRVSAFWVAVMRATSARVCGEFSGGASRRLSRAHVCLRIVFRAMRPIGAAVSAKFPRPPSKTSGSAHRGRRPDRALAGLPTVSCQLARESPESKELFSVPPLRALLLAFTSTAVRARAAVPALSDICSTITRPIVPEKWSESPLKGTPPNQNQTGV